MLLNIRSKRIVFIILNDCHFFLDGELYSGTVADFSASDSLIIKNVTSAKKWDNRLTRLRTEQYDFKQLNGKYCISYMF